MILQRLKQETRSYHEQVERGLDICDEHLTLARYTRILAHFLGFYQPVEQLLSTFQAGYILHREVERRNKTPWLLHDLTALGIADTDVAALPTCDDLPTLDTLSSVLGCMYVLEGATLGGQIISMHIHRVLRLNEHEGCAFFHGYGANTGAMWRAFGELLETHSSNEETHSSNEETENAVICAARTTFIVLHQWLLVGARI